MNTIKRWRWYHGVMFYVFVQLASFGLAKLAQANSGRNTAKLGEALVGNELNSLFYNTFKQPRFAPPDWSFPPVWTINNALCIWGLVRVLNMPKGTPGRQAFVGWQALVWVCFLTFNALYFGQRSPINGAINTNIGLLGTLASVYVALFRLKDQQAALSQATILPWLLLASPTATAIAAWNRDEFYDTEAPIEAPSAWVKVRKD